MASHAPARSVTGPPQRRPRTVPSSQPKESSKPKPSTIDKCLYGPTGIPFPIFSLVDLRSSSTRLVAAEKEDPAASTLAGAELSPRCTQRPAEHADAGCSNKEQLHNKQQLLAPHNNESSATPTQTPSLEMSVLDMDDRWAKRDAANVLSETLRNQDSNILPLGEDTTGFSNSSDGSPTKLPDHIVDLQEIRRLSSQGIPHHGSHRAVAWRVLLGYLPPDTSQWDEVLRRDRGLYRNLVAELFVRPSHTDENGRDLEGKRLRGRGIERDGLVNMRFSAEKEQNNSLLRYEKNNSNEGNNNNVVLQNFMPGDGSQGGGEGVEVMSISKKLDSFVSKHERQSFAGNIEWEHRTSPVMTPELQELEKPANDVDVHSSNLVASATISERNDSHHPLSTRSSEDLMKDKAEESTVIIKEGEKVVEEISLSNDRPDDVSRRASTQDVVYASIAERKRLTSRPKISDLIGRDAPVPVHRPGMQDGIADLVPARVREQWKKSGRDTAALASMSVNDGGTSYGHMNALLVVDDQGYTPDGSRRERVIVNDDPLSLEHHDSKWAQFFENASMLDEIRKDVVRTHPDLQFFLEPQENLGQRRYAAIERILFVWAKLNKGVRYVQGMNEIVGTIYFVLANDTNEDWACEAEADSYFLFNTLMVEMRDVFVPDLDDADTGIQGRIANMIALLSLHDPEMRCHLDDCGIDPSFYSIRWLTTLLSREFLLPDTIRLWDSMFASTHKDNFMRYVCVTMVMIIREDLLKGDFGTCLRLLQAYPPTNVDRLLESSRALWIYESQVTLACHKGGISLQQALTAIAPPPAILMAYGLHNGHAFDHVERMRIVSEKGLAVARGAAKEASTTMAAAGKNFFGNAKGWFLGNSSDRRKDREVQKLKTTPS